ncbi:MAG: ARMT1-like domain-containing protein [Sedimentisphaerales bacterium]
MKTYLDCIPCFFEQALRAGRMATDDVELLKRLLDELGRMLGEVSLASTPPETGRLIYQLVGRVTGNHDPFQQLKRESTERALALYPVMKKTIEEADDGLLTAIRIAIAGNVIDLGPSATFDIEAELQDVMKREFAIRDYMAFKRHLADSEQVLFIGDNAGETVFDRLLIEHMNKPTVYVVRERPIINDATYDDAVRAGLESVATIMSSGTDAPGTVISTCSPEFRKILDQSDFVVAKGQGNYEALSNYPRPIFFLLKAKCRIIADAIGVSQGDIILEGINI